MNGDYLYGFGIGLLGLGLLAGVLGYSSREHSVQNSNVLGNTEQEKYLERDGVRYYSIIDGKSVEDYVRDNAD